MSEVIRLTKNTKLELPVIFGGFYGLRRSEIVGLRWSAIDFDNNVFYVNRTVTTPNIDGKKTIVAKDRAKTKSSLRALPLNEDLKDRLIEIRKQQGQYQKKFKRSYDKKWLDYVMVDELGGLILPDYITPAWKRLLEKNNMRVIRFHDLRHPYVKLKLKLSSVYFRRIFSTKILDFPLYFKSVVGINAHLFNEHIRKCLC